MKANSLIKKKIKKIKIFIVTSLQLVNYLSSLHIVCSGEITSTAQSEPSFKYFFGEICTYSY